jgi:hypothetical protein
MENTPHLHGFAMHLLEGGYDIRTTRDSPRGGAGCLVENRICFEAESMSLW